MLADRHVVMRHSLRCRTLLVCVVLTSVLIASGCGTVNHLREAQDAFNQAAAADNKLKTDPLGLDITGETFVTLSVMRNSGYATAVNSLNKLTAQDIQHLKKDRLWGNVLTLKAMAQWRLGNYDEARETVDEAARLPEKQLHPRDRALIAALPGLIRIDEAFNKIYRQELPAQKTKEEYFKEIKDLIDSGVNEIGKARKLAHKDHPVQGYLIQAQLAGYVNLIQAYTRWVGPIAIPTQSERKKAQTQYCALEGLLKRQEFNVESRAQTRVLFGWKQRTGLSQACPN